MNTFLKFLLLSCQVRIDPLLWGGGVGGGGEGMYGRYNITYNEQSVNIILLQVVTS